MNKPHPRPARHDAADATAAEESLIGSALLDPAILDRLGGVGGHQFADVALGQLIDLLRDLRDSGRPVDLVTVWPLIRARGIEITQARLAKLFTAVPVPAHARLYADQVQDSFRRRELVDLAARLAERAADPTWPIDDTLAAVEARLETVRLDQTGGAVNIADGIDALLADIDARGGERRRAESGLRSLDDLIGGWQGGEVIVLAARPGIGKTSLMMQTARHNAELGRPVLLVSLEMTRDELIGRELVNLTDVPSPVLRSGKLNTADRAAIREARARLESVPLKIIAPGLATVADIRREARALQAAGGLDLLMIDYLSLVAPADRRQVRWEAVSEISRSIKRLAKELSCPVLVAQQLNREADQQEPRLSHLRESGAVEQDADQVLFLHRPAMRESQTGSRHEVETSLIVAKNRHGAIGQLRILFDPARTTFRDPSIGEDWQP